jgi:2-dehydro-3-deoxyphosphogluconate aldolase / (4S)-4-hydroxy-2-oxoglutarate aldolase
MARFRRLEVLQAMMASGLVPVFYHQDLETTKKVARAVADGGVKVLEFTNRGDFAYQIFSALIQWCEKEIPDLILGVGSVIDPGTAALYINNGANFIVGPVLNAEVARICNRRKIPYLPGCGSASEVSQAEEYGVEICKIFPGKEVGGAAFVKNILAPMPWTLIMPTGGVETTRESIEAWFKAGVACVGVGSNLIAKGLIAAGDFAAITQKAAEVLTWINEVRGRSVFAGIEHVGLNPAGNAGGKEITQWYVDTFGFKGTEGASSFFLSSSGAGRIEVMKGPESGKPHLAVRVTDFELACSILKGKGIELEEPKIRHDAKSVFLKGTDPVGNRIHLLWNKM